ncbi:MAG TPA: O-antigen ligase family protein [Polyangia bacterium]|nr:O-antigen ligase family protein [Polyangia bacterium]
MQSRLRSCAGGALVATAAALPFELEATLPLGPLRLSSVEIFLYATLALWGASVVVWPAALRSAKRDPAHRAAAAMALVMLASAAVAPAFRAAAIKFTLRSWGGILLFAASADLLRAPQLRRRVLQALVAGASAAATLAIAEAYLPRTWVLLRPFHGQVFQALGITRGSGPFQFPNIAAMAFEAALPVALGLGTGPLAAGVSVLLLTGVVATGSRAGLVVACLALAALAVPRLRDVRSRATARGLLIAAGLVVALGLATGGALATRLAFWREGSWYRAVITPAGQQIDRLPARLPVGGQMTAPIRVQNQGGFTWPHQPPSQVRLSYHWLDAVTGEVLVRDGLRTPLPADLPPGGELVLRAAVRAPARAGRYVLEWDAVQEDVTWFHAPGAGAFHQLVLVGDVSSAGWTGLRPGLAFGPPAPPSRLELWRAATAAFRARPLLGVGPDNFRHVYAGYLRLPAADERMHANNLYFETLADLGIAGLCALAALILALARAARRVTAVRDEPLPYGVALALGAFLLHGALDYFFEFTPTYAMFWLLAGALVALDRQLKDTFP